uniref:Uncharacterized protein n=1 Tax=Panagrolaimus superbus TaxID=310955 RepID=A0A914YAB0_9BILA
MSKRQVQIAAQRCNDEPTTSPKKSDAVKCKTDTSVLIIGTDYVNISLTDVSKEQQLINAEVGAKLVECLQKNGFLQHDSEPSSPPPISPAEETTTRKRPTQPAIVVPTKKSRLLSNNEFFPAEN